MIHRFTGASVLKHGCDIHQRHVWIMGLSTVFQHRAGETEAKAKLFEKLVAASATVSCSSEIHNDMPLIKDHRNGRPWPAMACDMKQ